MRARALLAWIALAACVAVSAAVVLYFAPWRDSPAPPHRSDPPPEPRLTYSGPYLNVRPDVKYVGDAVCACCHQEQQHSFRHHPMGRSSMTIAEDNQRALETVEHHNPFPALGSTMRIDRDEGDRVWHREIRNDENGKPIYVNSFDVSFVVGSGNHGHSYLC